MGLIPSLKGRQTMFSLVFAFGSMFFGIGAVKFLGTTAVIAVPAVLNKKVKELEGNMRLGINTEYLKSRAARGLPEETLEEFQFQANQLPEEMHGLLAQKWIVTERQLFMLLAMVRAQMLRTCKGPYAAQWMRLCIKHGMPYTEMMAVAQLLASEPDYDELIWISNNRLGDENLRKKLMASG
jgi:hypothetical protein